MSQHCLNQESWSWQFKSWQLVFLESLDSLENDVSTVKKVFKNVHLESRDALRYRFSTEPSLRVSIQNLDLKSLKTDISNVKKVLTVQEPTSWQSRNYRSRSQLVSTVEAFRHIVLHGKKSLRLRQTFSFFTMVHFNSIMVYFSLILWVKNKMNWKRLKGKERIHRKTKRGRETEIHKCNHRETKKQRQRTERQRDRETERQRDRETERQRDRETERQTYREAEIQTDRNTERQK